MEKYKNKKIAILGYGIEGQDTERFFKSHGIEVTILDQKDDPDYLKDLKQFDLIVRSPGVYRYLPEIVDAEKNGSKITSPIKIFFENSPAKIIGVTGTKGKGTTSTLIYEILKKDDRNVFLAGNIGKPYLELIPNLNEESWVVLEMSSFQLIDLNLSPHIGVVLNVTEDHMDWHKDREEYLKAKQNIVNYQNSDDIAVINEEYDSSRRFAEFAKGKIVFFSKQKLETKFKENILLKGEHNLENIAAAVAVSKCLLIPDEVVLETLKTFKGLEHRLELVREVEGVKFYNDSFATGPVATIAAINSFEEPITLILGGSDKGLDYKDLRKTVKEKINVKNLILIGDIGEKIAEGIDNKNITSLGKTSMNRIIEVALEVTPKGGVVVLSPAAASFDMFENYKDRGDQFKQAVNELKNE